MAGRPGSGRTNRIATPADEGDRPMDTRSRRWSRVIPVLALAASACSAHAPGEATRHDMTQGRGASVGAPVLYDSLGSYSYRITTRSPEAQRWFDQGLRLVYA